MSVTRYEYFPASVAGVNVGTPTGGQVTLDETWAPHVQVTLDLPYTAAAYAACDPRLGSGFRNLGFRVDRYRDGYPTVQKGFNLVITGRSVDRAREVITITGSSMESRLLGARNVSSTPDETLLQWQTTAELGYGVIDLEDVGTGYYLEESSIPIPVQVDSRNLIPNPSAESGIEFTLAVRCALSRQVTSASPFGAARFKLDATANNDSYMTVGGDAGEGLTNGITPGRTYTVSGTIIRDGNLPGANLRARRIVVFTRIGNGPYVEITSDQAPNSAGSTRLSVTFDVPEAATETFIRFYMGHTSGTLYWDGLKLVETVPGDRTVLDYWDGDTTDTDDYAYGWEGAAGSSPSNRVALKERSPDAFILQPGESIWDKVSALFASVGQRFFDPGGRRWRLVDDSYIADGGVRFIWDELTEWNSGLSLEDEDSDWCDAAVVRYFWRDWLGNERERFDTFGPTTARKVRRLELNTPYPGAGLAKNIVERSAGYADAVTFTAVADWTVIPTQLVTVSMPDESLLSALVRRVVFDFDADTMSIETRGVTTPDPAAWVLIPTGVSNWWTNNPVGASWIGEVIG